MFKLPKVNKKQQLPNDLLPLNNRYQTEFKESTATVKGNEKGFNMMSKRASIPGSNNNSRTQLV